MLITGEKMINKIFVIILFFLTVGCQNNIKSESIWPTNIKSIAIEIFNNDTLTPGIERDLALALEHEILSRTPYVITSRSSADSILSGSITNHNISQLSASRQTRLLNEALVSIEINFDWRNQNTGLLIEGKKSISASGLFTPSRSRTYTDETFSRLENVSPGEGLSIGQYEAVEKLSRQIVDLMEAPW